MHLNKNESSNGVTSLIFIKGNVSILSTKKGHGCPTAVTQMSNNRVLINTQINHLSLLKRCLVIVIIVISKQTKGFKFNFRRGPEYSLSSCQGLKPLDGGVSILSMALNLRHRSNLGLFFYSSS